MNLSIVIPAYNEEKRIERTLQKIEKYASKNFKNYEIIVVDDCSQDNTSEISLKYENVKILKNSKNMGKGYSVRRGILCAKYELVLFTDADLATPIEEIEKLLFKIKQGHDIAIASRNLKNSIIVVQQAKYRQLMGKTFPLLVRCFILPDFKDTQCGFKLFKTNIAKEIFAKQKSNGFAFDVEVLYLAKKLRCKIAEVPVVWIDQKGSKLNPLKDALKMLIELVKIKEFISN